MAAIRIIDSHLELANIGTNTHAQIDTHIAAAGNYVKRDGSLALTADWDIGDGRKILADEIRARDAAGLKLYDDGGNGIFVEDGGDVGIGTGSPYVDLDIGGLFNPSLGAWHDPSFAISSNINKVTGMHFRNISTGTGADSRFIVSDTTDHYLAFAMPSVGYIGGTLFGLNRSQTDFIFNFGGTTRDLAIGNMDNKNLILGTNGAERLRINNDGRIGILTTSPTADLDVNSDIIRLRTAKTPATAGAAGNQGDICWDAGYIYVCTATNSWERAAIAAW